jgi:hypothetical protein
MPGETIAGLARHAEVAHLGVAQPMDDPALDYGSCADASADGQVHERVQTTGGPPSAFAQRGGVDVGVEPHWHAQRVLEWPDHVDVGPARFRAERDEPILRMGSAQLQRAERRDADRGQRPTGRHLPLEESEHLSQRLGWFPGRDPGLGNDVIRIGPDQAEDLRPAYLDRPQPRQLHLPEPFSPDPSTGRSEANQVVR